MSRDTFDLVVIGGGVTGAGTALDAASRGLSVALIEQRDYASGTSSRSSKLFHGGIRYLEQFNFGLVREALTERNLMLTRLCPHLANPVSFVYPLKHRFWERLYVGAGVLLYELMARGTRDTLPVHNHLSTAELAELAPGLDPSRHRGGVRYWDVLVDDARHTMTHGSHSSSSRCRHGLEHQSGGQLAQSRKTLILTTNPPTDATHSKRDGDVMFFLCKP